MGHAGHYLKPGLNVKIRRASQTIQIDGSLPGGLRLYAIGDIHGRLDLVEGLVGIIEHDNSNREPARTNLIFLGDYVDRGPYSKGVVDWLINARARCNLLKRDRVSAPPPPFGFLFLKGNHEQLLLSFLEDPAVGRLWLKHGGDATLLSYGVGERVVSHALRLGQPWLTEASAIFRALLPDNHFQFYRALELFYRAGNYLFVHAGVNPDVSLGDQSEEDLLWIRDRFLKSSHDFGAVIVHGHSPAPTPEDFPTRIGIDTFAVNTGRLTAVGLEGNRRWFLST
jgi:serine/threonine protein phosphatase 1